MAKRAESPFNDRSKMSRQQLPNPVLLFCFWMKLDRFLSVTFKDRDN